MDMPRPDPTNEKTPGVVGGANLTAQATSGLSWSALSTVALVVANLAYTAIISRLLRQRRCGVGHRERPLGS
jgi:hypothetical protein